MTRISLVKKYLTNNKYCRIWFRFIPITWYFELEWSL